MAAVQMNVRIDEALKDEGDAVLRELGVSASDAIRALWTYLADRRALPDMSTTADEAAREAERQRRLKLVRESAGMVHRAFVEAGLIGEDEDLLDGMDDAELKDYRRQLAYERYMNRNGNWEAA
ncbi:DNA-damage-inducible protein J [Bifidobacterium avesanii]|uniref:Damage-inducible protein J n=2 Tax=Bifidobacterium avesanii TaxID=1798157 RepID=A0A7K3TJP8_9BIFI|nr:DNA-damage-inducible protein J [Bifidobacterium avesanii]NEG78850.1 damage-inducible protein J [Bifidobacterium avesanii]